MLLTLVSGSSFAVPAFGGPAHNFFLAISMNNGYEVTKMLKQGINPNIKDEIRGDPGLILALRENAMDAFDVLLNFPAIDIEAMANNGDTALMIASYTENLVAVRALLNKDAEPNKPGWTALHYASAKGNIEIIQLLLDNSAYIDAESPNGTTPLMMAAKGGFLKAAKLLVQEGADLSLKNQLGLDAVDFAMQNDHRDVAEWLKSRAQVAH